MKISVRGAGSCADLSQRPQSILSDFGAFEARLDGATDCFLPVMGDVMSGDAPMLQLVAPVIRVQSPACCGSAIRRDGQTHSSRKVPSFSLW